MFEDGPWKWEAQQRFAGTDLNCGTYFSLSLEGAKAEANYYAMDLADHVLIELEMELDSVLDLTHIENCRAVFHEAVANPEFISDSHFMTHVISELVDTTRAGNAITDAVGHSAESAGYDGILFFGARALTTKMREAIQIGRDNSMGFSTIDLWFNETKKKIEMLNLVVFSGMTVVQRTRRYRTVSENWIDNPLFGASVEILDQLMPLYGTEYQMSRSVALIGKVQYVKIRASKNTAKP